MNVVDAQREVRSVYLGGSVGQWVSGAIWLASAGLWTWASPRLGILALVLGGAFIFPLTQLVLRGMGRPASLSPGNPFRFLAMQIAFTVPLGLPLVGGVTLHRLGWFYPGMMILVGAHYLPFVTLYGMPAFAVLGAFLIAAGVALGMFVAGPAALGGWLTGAALVAFGFVGRAIAANEARSS